MRHKFGESPADVAMELDGSSLIVRPNSVGTVWDAATAGNQITDLRDIGGTTPMTEVTADNSGRVAFQGPDGVTVLYIDFGFGARFAMTATTIGSELAAKANDTDVVHDTGDETVNGLKTFQRAFIELADIVNPGLILRQNATVSSSDTEMLQAFYKTFKGWWLNEKSNPRARRVDSETVFKQFGRGNNSTANNTNNISEWYDDNAGVDRLVARVGAHGSSYFSNTDYTDWVNITIDSPTTATKYTAQTNGTNNYNAPQVRVVDGGRNAELRGRINVAAITGVSDEVIATTMPTSLTFLGMGGTVSSIPTRERRSAAYITGAGAQRIQINSSGSLQATGTVTGGSSVFISLDGMFYSLES